MGVPEKTLITGEEILEYIPQRPPVVMVDTFYGIDERGCARSGLTVTADNLFVADGVLDECGIVEHIAQSVALVGKPAALMNKEDKMRAIGFLSQSGAFLVTKSGDKVAKYFGISKYTLYSYIDKQQEDKQNG